MAELNLSPEEVKSFEEGLKRIKDAVKDGLGLDKAIPAINELGTRFGVNAGTIASAASEIKEAAKGILTSLAEMAEQGQAYFQKYFNAANEAVDSVKRKLGEAEVSNKNFGKKLLGVVAVAGLKYVPSHFEAIGKSAENMQSQLSDNNALIQRAADMKLISPEKAASFISMAKNIDATRNAIRGLTMTAATSGNMTEMIDRFGTGIDGMTAALNGMDSAASTIASATGMSKNQAMKYLDTLNKIPGAMDSISGTTSIAGEQLHYLTAASMLAAGTGQELESVLTQTAWAAENLAISGEDALSFINRIQIAADSLDLKPDEMRKFAEESASALAMLGDNSAAVINIMGKVGPALQKAKVAPKQLFDIMTHVTKQMGEMTTAQRAFLSASTGGPGGLQGAFQIEQMIADGKSDEVFDKVQKSLREKMGGGQIVTRKEASERGGNSAAQYQKQVMMMMSPAMGGLAKDKDSAAKLIDAMANSDFTSFAEGMKSSAPEDQSADLRSSFQRGHELQEIGNRDMHRVATFMQDFLDKSSTVANQMDAYRGGSENQQMQQLNRSEMKAQGAIMDNNVLTGTGGKDPTEYFNDIDKQFEALGPVVPEFAKDLFNKFANSMGISSDSSEAPAVMNDKEGKNSARVQSEEPSNKAFGGVQVSEPDDPRQKSAEMIQRMDQIKPGSKQKDQGQKDINVVVENKNIVVCSQCNQTQINSSIKHHHDEQNRASY